jgi:hypothetical protein
VGNIIPASDGAFKFHWLRAACSVWPHLQFLCHVVEMVDSMPSKVLHIRNLPEECTEMDLRSLSCQFGLVNRVLFLSRKQQAFVEFSTIEEAAMMLATCQAQPIRLGTRYLYIVVYLKGYLWVLLLIKLVFRNLIAQFSNKQEITIPVSDPSSRGGKPATGTDGRILLVTVTDVQFPVTLEVVYQARAIFFLFWQTTCSIEFLNW